jgi:hypothetical protein
MNATMKLVEPKFRDDSGIIDLLEKLLGEAKKGKLNAVAVAALSSSGEIITSWKTSGSYIDTFRLLGGLSYLQHRFNAEEVNDTPDRPLPWSG